MFNWLKNKLNNLIPGDFNKGFLTSNYVTVKVGDKITIPENAICFVSFHDKVYAELESGNHCLNEELLPNLYKKQKKNKKKLKKLNLDLFFINLNQQTLNIHYKDKILVNNKLVKFNIETNATANVVEAKTFNKFVCAEFYQPFAMNTNEFLSDLIENFIKKCFVKIRLNSDNVPQNIIDDINEKLKNYLRKIGLNLTSLRIAIKQTQKSTNSIFNTKTEDKPDEKTLFDGEKPSNIVDQPQKMDYNLTNAKSQDCNMCSNCGSKIIKGSLFCHRCGRTL